MERSCRFLSDDELKPCKIVSLKPVALILRKICVRFISKWRLFYSQVYCIQSKAKKEYVTDARMRTYTLTRVTFLIRDVFYRRTHVRHKETRRKERRESFVTQSTRRRASSQAPDVANALLPISVVIKFFTIDSIKSVATHPSVLNPLVHRLHISRVYYVSTFYRVSESSCRAIS